MIPDNYLGCKIAYQKWKDLGDGIADQPGHRDKCWASQNAEIEKINELARAEYIRQNGDDNGFFGIQRVDEELFKHLASYIWKQAGGEDIHDYSKDILYLLSKGDKDEALKVMKEGNYTTIDYWKFPYKGLTDKVALNIFHEAIIEAYYQRFFVKDLDKAKELFDKISSGEIYNSLKG